MSERPLRTVPQPRRDKRLSRCSPSGYSDLEPAPYMRDL